MKGLNRILWLVFLTCLTAPLVQAQSKEASTFDPEAAWDQSILKRSVNQYRTASGHPGPGYWQNHADYTIRVTLDTTSQLIRGSARIEYKNNSPNPLHIIWLHAGAPPQSEVSPSFAPHFALEQVAAIQDGERQTPRVQRSDTRIQVRLDRPVAANGGSTTLDLEFAVSLKPKGPPTRAHTSDGVIYEIGHWYPRVAIYNVGQGWGTISSRRSQEAHSAYASFDYHLTVPASLIVAGSGTLMNADEVLTNEQKRRLQRARSRSSKVAIITPDEAGTPATRPKQDGSLTWHFRMNGTRDVAWAASPAFIWNATQIQRPERREALAMSYYPPSSMGGEAWNRSTYHTQKTIKFYSKYIHTYPWNTAINVAGPIESEGFPGLAFCDRTASGYKLFSCTAREQGQNWFPGIVGTNKHRHPWMDEGLGTFIAAMAHRRLYDGEFAPKRDANYLPEEGSSEEEILSRMTAPDAPSILSPPGLVSADRRSALYSLKPALGLTLLREYVLEPNRFDYALRRFVHRWAFGEPSPRDFFRTMSDATGEDLSWFWNGWFANSWTIDLAVTSVEYVNGHPKKGARITVKLLQKMPMPIELKVIESDGDTRRVRRPVEIWQRGPARIVEVDTDSRLNSIVLDPDGHLPGVNPSNDNWSSKTLGKR